MPLSEAGLFREGLLLHHAGCLDVLNGFKILAFLEYFEIVHWPTLARSRESGG